MGYVDPKNKAKDGSSVGDDIDDLDSILDQLGISFENDTVEKVEEDRKPNRLDPKL